MLDSKNALWLLSAALLPFWEEPGRFGHRVLLRVFPLVRKLGQMLLQLLAVRNLFFGQWRLKRFGRRRRDRLCIKDFFPDIKDFFKCENDMISLAVTP